MPTGARIGKGGKDFQYPELEASANTAIDGYNLLKDELRRLDTSENLLTELPIELGALKELKTLILKGNPLKDGEVEKIQQLLPDCNIKL